MKITLCGSTRFKDQFEDWNRRLSKAGNTVYSVASYGHSGDTLTAEEKTTLDLVHLRKIAESEAIFVVGWDAAQADVYIGDSTRREVSWAQMHGKRIFMVNPNHEHGFEEMDAPSGPFVP